MIGANPGRPHVCQDLSFFALWPEGRGKYGEVFLGPKAQVEFVFLFL
jgi:hypothetical protein